MSVLFRVQSIFSGKEQGWSETIVYPGSDGQSPGNWFNVTGLAIAQKRAELLGREYTLSSHRISLIRNPAGQEVTHNALLVTQDFKPTDQTATNSAEQPNVDAVVQWIDALGSSKKNQFLGGIPDGIVTNGGDYDGTGAGGWNARFNSWSVLVIAAGGGWLQDIVNVGDVPVSTYVVNANKTITVTFASDLFVPADFGQTRIIRLKGINSGKSPLNTALRVNVTDATNCTTVEPIAVFPYSAGGRGSVYVSPKPYIAAAAMAVDRIGTHKRGRPSSARVGRARARARG